MTLYAIIFILLLLIVMMVTVPRIKKRKVINKLGQVTTINKLKNKGYDLKVTIDNIEYDTKILLIETESSLQINSKYYWQLNYGYNKKSTEFKHKRILDELNNFLKIEDDNKLLLIYPKVRYIKKYINESELKFVTSGEKVHGVMIYNYNDLMDEI